MDFREATENLCVPVTHGELAKALGVSVASIRQARLKPDANAHRSPPANWERTLIRLAEQQIYRYERLVKSLADQRSDSAA
jgi:hypothetical protein